MPRFRAPQILEWVYAKGEADPARMSNLSKLDREALARDFTFLSSTMVKHQRASDGTQKMLLEWDDGDRPRESNLDAPPTSPPASPPTAPNGAENGLHGGGENGEGAGAETNGAAERGDVDGGGRGVGENRPLTVIGGGRPKLGDSSRQTECVMIPVEQDETRTSRRTARITSQVGCPVGCRFCASGLGGLDGNLSTGRILEQVWRLGAMLREQGDPISRITNVVFMGMGEPLSNF